MIIFNKLNISPDIFETIPKSLSKQFCNLSILICKNYFLFFNQLRYIYMGKLDLDYKIRGRFFRTFGCIWDFLLEEFARLFNWKTNVLYSIKLSLFFIAKLKIPGFSDIKSLGQILKSTKMVTLKIWRIF